jgi:TRAP-type C4-dicarboxylate transport system permease small subunit
MLQGKEQKPRPGGDAESVFPASWLRVRGWVEALDKASFAVIILAMSAMTIMVSLQVFWRYVLGSSIDSADEVSRLLFVWVMFLAIPHGIKFSIHVGIDLVVAALSARKRVVLFRFVAAAGAVLMAAVFYASFVATADKWQELMPTLPVTAAVYYIAVLVSSAHSFVHLVLHAWMGPAIWEGRTL